MTKVNQTAKSPVATDTTGPVNDSGWGGYRVGPADAGLGSHNARVLPKY